MEEQQRYRKTRSYWSLGKPISSMLVQSVNHAMATSAPPIQNSTRIPGWFDSTEWVTTITSATTNPPMAVGECLIATSQSF